MVPRTEDTNDPSGDKANCSEDFECSIEPDPSFCDRHVVLESLCWLRRWKAPPGWSRRDWHEELGAQTIVVAIQAVRDFSATQGVPWEAFLRHRIIQSTLARYRREWASAPPESPQTSFDRPRASGHRLVRCAGANRETAIRSTRAKTRFGHPVKRLDRLAGEVRRHASTVTRDQPTGAE